MATFYFQSNVITKMQFYISIQINSMLIKEKTCTWKNLASVIIFTPYQCLRRFTLCHTKNSFNNWKTYPNHKQTREYLIGNNFQRQVIL